MGNQKAYVLTKGPGHQASNSFPILQPALNAEEQLIIW